MLHTMLRKKRKKKALYLQVFVVSRLEYNLLSSRTCQVTERDDVSKNLHKYHNPIPLLHVQGDSLEQLCSKAIGNS